MKLSDFHYDLPPELIARYPLAERSASRLLCLNGNTGEIAHQQFNYLLTLLKPNDLLVFNNTKVIPARLRGQKETGGRVEMLVERILDQHRVLAHVKTSKALRPGMHVMLNHDVRFEMLSRHDDLFELRCVDTRPVLDVIEAIGEIPLPMYFQREAEESDKERYQTVYAKTKGSVAAPTAGLHFDETILTALSEAGVKFGYLTLHVGAGTFAPVRAEIITDHKMHSEYIEVSEELCEQIKQTKAMGGRVIAVGTTSSRSLETASLSGEIAPFYGNTDIFIYPGFQFKCVDALITNLHVPGSSLLMLVSAFGGYSGIMQAYSEAVQQAYRFYSYGDAMFITRKTN
jgi:S-adenosylmethionine:tRNA ribosyltransferase-isomerase